MVGEGSETKMAGIVMVAAQPTSTSLCGLGTSHSHSQVKLKLEKNLQFILRASA